jgi:hypothetical protein
VRPRDWLLFPFCVAVGAGGVIWGAKNTYTSLHNRSPLTLTCAQFEAHPPDAQWLQLRECEPDVDSMAIESTGGLRPTAVYIPLRPPQHDALSRAKLILVIDRGPLLALGEKNASDDVYEPWIRDVRGGVTGLVELGVDRSERKKQELRDVGLNTVGDPALLVNGASPRPLWLALAALAAGLGAFGYLGMRFRRRQPHRPLDDVPAADDARTGG